VLEELKKKAKRSKKKYMLHGNEPGYTGGPVTHGKE
jgi:hypothetical protein